MPAENSLPDGPVVLGIRPESFEDASLATGLPAIDAVAEVLEDLGSDAHLFFTVDGALVTAEVLEAGDDARGLIDTGGALFTARIGARTSARVGDTIPLAIDPHTFHFFDTETGLRLEPLAVGGVASELTAMR